MTQVVNLSGNPDIDGILWGWEWGSGGAQNLTFSFPTGTAEYGYQEIDNFSAFTAAQQTAVRTALTNIASFTNLTFTETTSAGATLRYANADKIDYTDDSSVALHTGLHVPGNAPGTAEANPPELGYNGSAPFSAMGAQGDAWFVTGGYTNPVLGSFQDAAGIMHETGHNLGLKHGHVTQDGHGVTFPALPADHNSYEYSVMTYSQFPGDNATNGDNAPDHPTTYMQDDIAALQYMYGANYGATAHNGNTTYTWSVTTGEEFIDGVGQGAPQSNFVLMTLWDGGGTDTYDFSNYTTNLSIDLDPGAWTILDTSAAHAQRADLGNDGAGGAEYFARGNIANALIDPTNPTEIASLIEDANGGSGNDTIVGNAADNVLRGNGGNDTIDGGGGTNTVVYSGTRLQYIATLLGSGAIQIADQRGGSPDGTDTVTNIQKFEFADGTFNETEVLNRPPVLSPDPGSPHPLTELANTTNSASLQELLGTLTFTDANAGDTHTASEAFDTATWSGGVTVPLATQAALATALTDSIGVDGTSGTLNWQFDLADRNLDFLATGETLTVVYDVTVADHHTGSSVSDTSTQQITVVFTGTNDPVSVVPALSNLTGTISELPGVTGSSTPDATSGTIAFTDPDLNDRPTATIDAAGETVTWQDSTHDYTSELTPTQIASLEAAFTIVPEAGNTNAGKIDWSYSIVDKDLDFLSVGESLTVTVPVVIDDANGGAVTQDVVVTINGANDAPIAVADSNGTAKKSTLSVDASHGVLSNDTDPDIHDQGHSVVSAVDGAAGNVGHTIAGTYGSLTLNADGSYVYVANKGGLPSQIVAQDTFAYTIADPHGATASSTLSIVVFNPGVDYQAGSHTTLNGGNGQDVLDGSAGHDILIGGNGPDVLIGGDGDTLTGNNGPDTFLFRPHFGTNVITDFVAHNDAVQLDKSIFASVNDMLSNHTADTAAGAVITDAFGDTITFAGIKAAELQAHAGDFHLV
uniref:M10 family metallopeptidase C-terminal domain-containing protein n=1 Tax=Bradyrhizobium quebecense TaxID=2748629 RepID=A0A973WJL6_9BRAD